MWIAVIELIPGRFLRQEFQSGTPYNIPELVVLFATASACFECKVVKEKKLYGNASNLQIWCISESKRFLRLLSGSVITFLFM